MWMTMALNVKTQYIDFSTKVEELEKLDKFNFSKQSIFQ